MRTENTEEIQKAAAEWQKLEEEGSLQRFYWSQTTQRALRLLLRVCLLLAFATYIYTVFVEWQGSRKEGAVAEVKGSVLPLGIEAIPRESVVPRPRGTSPISVLDLDTITPELCAANLAAIQSKDFGKLQGRIATKLTNGKTEWLKGKGDDITIIQRMIPIDPSLAGTVVKWQLLSLTKTTLTDSIAVREAAGVKKGLKAAQVDMKAMGLAVPAIETQAEPVLFPVFRDGKKIYCYDLAGSLPLTGRCAVTLKLPSINDTATTIDGTTLATIGRKSLEAAEPGDFINSVLILAVETVDEQGTIKGHLLDRELHPTDKTVEIRSADKVAGLKTGQGGRYDATQSLQVIQKTPLILIDRSTHAR